MWVSFRFCWMKTVSIGRILSQNRFGKKPPARPEKAGGAEVFIGELSRLWNGRYPRNRFLPGTFEKLMKGFDANLLGLPLRKSK